MWNYCEYDIKTTAEMRAGILCMDRRTSSVAGEQHGKQNIIIDKHKPILYIVIF